MIRTYHINARPENTEFLAFSIEPEFDVVVVSNGNSHIVICPESKTMYDVVADNVQDAIRNYIDYEYDMVALYRHTYEGWERTEETAWAGGCVSIEQSNELPNNWKMVTEV